MVIEIVHIVARAGEASELSANYQAALEVVMRHEGARSGWVARQREDTDDFTLYIEWESLEAHKDFGASDLLQEFRDCIGGRVGSASGGHYDVVARVERSAG